MAAEQIALGRLDPTLFGAGNRMPRHEARQLLRQLTPGGTQDIALGTPHIRQHRLPQGQAAQAGQQLLHGENRRGQLNDAGADTGCRQIGLTAIDHAQLDRQTTGLGIQIDADHFAEQPGLAHALGKRAANQPQANHHQPLQRLDHCSHRLSHGPVPAPAR